MLDSSTASSAPAMLPSSEQVDEWPQLQRIEASISCTLLRAFRVSFDHQGERLRYNVSAAGLTEAVAMAVIQLHAGQPCQLTSELLMCERQERSLLIFDEHFKCVVPLDTKIDS